MSKGFPIAPSMPCALPWSRLLLACVIGFGFLAPAHSAEEQSSYVAGLAPDRRPEKAPVVKTAPGERVRDNVARFGVTPPVPGLIEKFLDDQGAWYTPFSRPGMTGPYDIRGWHAAAAVSPQKPAAELAKPNATKPNYLRAAYDPIHNKPAIDKASDAQCMACHAEVMGDKVRSNAEAGLSAKNTLAWYQRVSTYTGEQDTFHRRHMATDYSKQVMTMQCTTCHQGNDLREEAPGSSASALPKTSTDITLRKHVNPETVCLKCHGKFPYQLMGLPNDWPQVKEMMGNNCLTCHAAIRTNRHQVSYLKAAEIEKLGANNSEVCFGCHGGRSWYRIAYPYPRHKWEGMPEEVPDWAKKRPTQSEPRFIKPASQSVVSTNR